MKTTTQAANHPRKGSVIIIEPLRSLEDVAKVKAVLKDHPRNLALFVLGINCGLRASDLLKLRYSDINWARGEIIIREKKTGKIREIFIATPVMQLLQAIKKDSKEDYYLFRSEKTGEALTVSSLNAMIKLWFFRAGIKGNFGSHALRKSFAHLHWKFFGTPVEVISQMLNHDNLGTTYRYLGIMREDHKKVYLQVL